jgi:hypothetical protein
MQGEQRLTDFGDRWIELRLILGKTVSLLLRKYFRRSLDPFSGYLTDCNALGIRGDAILALLIFHLYQVPCKLGGTLCTFGTSRVEYLYPSRLADQRHKHTPTRKSPPLPTTPIILPTMAPPTDPNEPASASNNDKSFFDDFPRELCDSIYDILHQHEQEVSVGQLTFRFPLTHLRHISRRLRAEYGSRAPATSQMIISQRNGGYLHSTWSTSPPMKCPRITLLGRALHCNTLEFNANVCGAEVSDPQGLEWYVILAYCELPERFLGVHNDTYLAKTTRKGEVHMRLCFKNRGNLERIEHHMADMKWASRSCIKVSLLFYSEGDDTPSKESLSRAQTVAIADQDSGWKLEDTPDSQPYTEPPDGEYDLFDQNGWPQ